MGKFIFCVAIAALIYWVIKKRPHKHKEKTKKFPDSIENMVSYAYCDVHLPESDAISSHNNQFFCSQEHRNLYTNSSF